MPNGAEKVSLVAEPRSTPKPAPATAAPAKKTEAPSSSVNAFSIKSWLNRAEEKPDTVEEKPQDLPAAHFTETDLHEHWSEFLVDLREKDPVKFAAISTCILLKAGENLINIKIPSQAVKAEMETVRRRFLNHFMHRVNNFSIKVEYVQDENLKKEILTKRKIFDKFAEINPALNDLEDLMRFDFS